MDDAARDPVPQAVTAGEYVALLRDARRRSGLTYRDIARRASAAGHWLPPSTLATMLGRTTLPRERTVVAMLAAIGTPAGEVERLLGMRRDIEARLDERDRCETQPARDTADPRPGVDPAPGVDPVPPEPPRSRAPRPVRRWLRPALLAVVGVLTVGTTGVLLPKAVATVDDAPTADCPLVLRQGMYGPCVLDLQEHLVAGGLAVPVDGWFGPDTTSRVIAFQAMGGMPVSGIADGRVLDELADAPPVPPTWSEERIGKYLRLVFPEDPGGAVRVARCLSGLDPYRVEVVADGSRRWGLFQFSDTELSRLGVDGRTALDPGWNIRAARDVWSRAGGFGHWRCAPSP
ncbi:peptidoglycan-binding protein [Micromonospora tarensis]|uniref:Peptidoglycan-binding protein n=1 Tax=Micromonospora tarensis TaxID=2806100 RepID=A0ABS1YRC9_9ACTN|nr:peptidoglycan-binding protein [Micromonospora tarensis]MBM0279661.1 peptidoglycan-binding protein [Micromonospora tarensis]